MEYLVILMVCSEQLLTVFYFLFFILIEYLAILIVSTEQLHAGSSFLTFPWFILMDFQPIQMVCTQEL